MTDSQMLMIGAQENLQRQDLDPVEEAQIVAWLERMFFEKNQAEIGAMLGKSSDWVSTRSRIHRLPDPLKERLRQRPRAIAHMLELASLHEIDPTMAVVCADRIVHEQLTLEAVRLLLQDNTQSTLHKMEARERIHDRRDVATNVQNITNEEGLERAVRVPDLTEGPEEATKLLIEHPVEPSFEAVTLDELSDLENRPLSNDAFDQPQITISEEQTSTHTAAAFQMLEQFQELVTAIEKVASNAEQLPANPSTVQALIRAEHSLRVIRHTISRNWVKHHR